MGTGSIQLARLFGIRIGASPSWFVVLFLMIYYLSGVFDTALEGNSNDTAYVVAVIGALLFFVSLVLHELGHALVARRNGIGVVEHRAVVLRRAGEAHARPDDAGRGLPHLRPPARPSRSRPRRVLRRAGRARASATSWRR